MQRKNEKTIITKKNKGEKKLYVKKVKKGPTYKLTNNNKSNGIKEIKCRII